MTIKYVGQFATSSYLGSFVTLLFRWRGSVFKLIAKEYVIFITLYFIINLVYRKVLEDDQKRYFETLSKYCNKCTDSFQMKFVLGFFVTSIITKWWKMYDMIPWPDSIAYFIQNGIRDTDQVANPIKKTIMRHCCLSLTLSVLAISPSLQKRFPTFDHLIQQGMLTENEKVKLEKVDKKASHFNHWLPMLWASDLLAESVEKGKLDKSHGSKTIEIVDKFRQNCVLLLEYEQWTVPLAYIQVVTVSVYSYFLLSLFGEQWLEKNKDLKDLDLYFPFFATLEFIFYMGWLKVAESIINPFGHDDDDFDLDQIILRHFQITQAMVSATDDERFTIKSAPRNNNVFTYFVNEAFEGDESSSNPKREGMSLRLPGFSKILSMKEKKENNVNVTVFKKREEFEDDNWRKSNDDHQ